MDAKLRERFTHRLSPQLFSSDEGPETGDESDEDMIRDYLPPDPHEIPAINITLHSPNSNHVLESEICQLADIQENIQRMREGEAVGAVSSCPSKSSVEARLSSSCPSLNVESGEEGSTPTGRRRQGRASLQKDHKSHRKRTERQRSLSVSTGESNDDSEGGNDAVDGRNSMVLPTRRDRAASAVLPEDFRSGLPQRPGGNCVEAVNPAASKASPNQAAASRTSPHPSRTSPHLLAQLPHLHKSVSTPSMVPKETSNDSSTASGKTSRRARLPEPTHVFIQKLIAEHGWTHQTQRSGTESETEGEEGGPVIDRVIDHRRYLNQLPSPQLTLAEFLQNPALAEEEQRKRRRNKKERGGSLFSLRKKKDKKDGKGLAKAGSAVSLQSRVVTAPRIPQHSYSMSSLKRYPPPQNNSQFYLARSESSKSTEEREDVDGDREALLEAEQPPGMEFPEGGPAAIRHLDTDPFLRIQKEEPETWAASVPEGVAAALKPHEAKRQEHIYEFIMTEKHHCQLLKVMQKVFAEGMVTCLDVKQDVLDRIFPQLDELISLHFEFLRMLRERQDSTAVIPTIADILLAQFQGHTASRWKGAFGAFCSQHSDAVTVYKDILKSDRRFQEFVQECSHNPLLHKRGIPESILTVTTRITKYPLLIEPLIKTAKERPEEQQKLRDCHRLVKAILVDVNNQVAEKERGQRLLEIYNRMDARSYVSYEGRKFKKSDMMLEGRKLLFDGTGTLHQPGVVGQSRGGRSPSPLLVNVVVLSDVLLFLQDSNQKYSFVTPDNKSGVVPVHSLIAREKPGTDTKALYLISTSDREPEMYELTVSQPRDRHDWISGIRRAVDLSTGGSPEDEQFEVEAEEARNQLDARFMKLRGLTSELRGRDMELAKLLEEKMRLLGEMLDVLGVENPLPGAAKYLHLVQEQNMAEGSITKEKLLEAVQEASRLASSIYSSNSLGRSVSSVGEHQSEGYESPSLPKRAETFGGFDTTLSGEMSKTGLKRRGLNDWAGLGLPATPPLLGLDHSQQAAAVHMTHYLNNIMCMVSEHFTSLEGLKVELAECREKAALGWGRYKHNQQLEELRNLQEELALEKRTWQAEKTQAERDLHEKKEAQAKLQTNLEREQKDIEEQRNKLFRKLEALSAQGIDFAPNMTVIGPTPTSDPAPVALVMEVRKTVSPAGMDNRKPSSLPPPPNPVKKTSDKNQHLLSATNETKGDAVEVKQQIPSKLAKLSMSGTAKKDKKSLSVRPSISGPILTTPSSYSQQPQQMLPIKLSEQVDRKSGSSSLSSPKQGYQKLSSSSFVEERVGRLTGREEANHTRTGSSPAAMTGRPMSNTLPKAATRAVSPESQDSKALKEIQKVNYADSGEEVFFF